MKDSKRTTPLPTERLRRLRMTQQQFMDYISFKDEKCSRSIISNALNNWREASPRTVRIIEGALDELERRRRIK